MLTIKNSRLKETLLALSPHQTILCLSGVAAVLTAWLLYNQHGWVNDDSVLYFEVARLIAIGEWKASLALYDWPFYPWLIAGLHQITGLSFQHSAQILSIFFFSLTTYSYLKIIALAGGNKTTLLIASLLLFSTRYIVGDVLTMLLRDQGFWACFLTALLLLIQFHRHHTVKLALGWQISAIFAMLFRVEAAIFLIFLPFSLFLLPNASLKSRTFAFLKLHALNLFLLLMLVILLLFSDLSSNHLGRFNEILTSFSDFNHAISQTFTTKAELVASAVLGGYLSEYAWLSVIITYLLIVAIKSISVAGWLPALLVFSHRSSLKSTMTTECWRVLLASAMLAYISAIFIIFKQNLLSSRYVISFGFISLIFSALVLSAMFQQWQLSRSKWKLTVLVLVGAFLSFNLIANILPKKDGYNYEQEAVTFLKQHNIAVKDVFFVSPRARYYAGVQYNDRGYDYWNYTESAINNGEVFKYQYLLIPLNDKNLFTEKEAILRVKLKQFKVIATFYNEKKSKKIILLEQSAAVN